MADIWSIEKRSQVMSKIRSTNTRPEILLRKALFAKGYRYRIHCKAMPGKPDIVFAKYKTVVFVHGCFWHYHQDCREGRIPSSNSKFWTEKLSKNVSRDLKHQEALKNQGWTVLVIWECEIEKQLQTVIERIERNIRNLGFG